MPADRLSALPGYDPDVQNRAEARIVQRLGYGLANPLAIKVAARNIPLYRDPAVTLIDQLKEIYVTGELESDAPGLQGRIENTGSAVVDDPDQQLYESYACDSDRNFTGYCNRALEYLSHRQSRETDPQRRREPVWDMDRPSS